MAYNKVILIGRMTKDAEVKNTSNQKTYATFSLAVDRNFKDASGNKQADFINVVAWGSTAGFVSHYFKKGSPILIEGQIQSRNYTNSEGKKVYVTEVVADHASFVDGDSKPAEKSNAPTAPSTPLEVPVEVSEPLADEDLPFDL